MDMIGGHQPEFDYLKDLLLLLSQQRTVQGIIETFARELVAARPHVARLAVWMMDGTELKLAASCWQAGDQIPQEWKHSEGGFSHVPVTEPLIGQIVAKKQAQSARAENEWRIYPEWAQRDGLMSYYAAPIRHYEEIYGVIGSFLRFRFTDEALHQQAVAWTQVFADHVGAMIANARAFEQIEVLSRKLELENAYLREEVRVANRFGDIIGESAVLQRTLRQIEMVAPTDATVLILGETGTGKELVARAIHEQSQRRGGPMVKVNCASIPRELFESEFFGHVRGAFTGAVKDRIGRFQLADGGTLFLDELGEIPLELQSKLLRVLQEGTFERVGEERTRRVNVRIITATNRDLLVEARAGRFREDLYYRLSVYPISLAPLRERREDIGLLARHFLTQASSRLGRPRLRFTERHLQRLTDYNWPGNIRELQNVIERAVITAENGELCFDALAPALPQTAVASVAKDSDRILTYAELEALERHNLLRALEQTDWKISGTGGTAELVGLKPTTLTARLKVKGIRRK